MLIKKSDSQNFEIPGGTSGTLYPPGPNKDFSLAIVETNGVYPEAGWSLNDYCSENLYMLEGEFTVTVSNEEYKIGPGDLLCITPKNKYKISGKGRAMVIITPAWEKSQNHILPE